MATSTLRFVIIVALVAGGAVLIGRAFPQAGTPGLPGGAGAPGGSPSVTRTPSPTKPPKSRPSPQVQGVRVAVFNGTSVSMLAAKVADQLSRRFGYQVAQAPGNTPSPVSTTTLYYRTPKDKVEARAMARSFFRKLDPPPTIAKLPANATLVDATVQVAVYLGTDYAQATG